jgi:hypothetical protein
MCAVAIEVRHVRMCRKTMLSLRRPGQRRIHFVNERPDRRRGLLAEIGSLPASAYFLSASGKHVPARRNCLQNAMIALADRPVRRFVLEAGDAEDHRDRQTATAMSAKVPWLSSVYLEHLRSHEEPLLWIPDALAWAYSAGGEWRDRIAAIGAG